MKLLGHDSGTYTFTLSPPPNPTDITGLIKEGHNIDEKEEGGVKISRDFEDWNRTPMMKSQNRGTIPFRICRKESGIRGESHSSWDGEVPLSTKQGEFLKKSPPWETNVCNLRPRTQRQESANFRLNLAIFVNTVLWEHSHTHSLTYMANSK